MTKIPVKKFRLSVYRGRSGWQYVGAEETLFKAKKRARNTHPHGNWRISWDQGRIEYDLWPKGATR